MLEIFILITPLLIMFVIALQSVYLGISPMPSSRKVVKAIKPYINDHSIKSIADLGSGWGGILKQLTKANKEAKVEGFEIAWIPFFYSLLTKTRETNVIFANFLKNNLNKYDLLYCYLFPNAMVKLSTKLKKELKPGAIVISNTFQLPGWKPVKVIKISDFFGSKIYIYRR